MSITKTSMHLNELAQEVQRQAKLKKDFIVGTEALSMIEPNQLKVRDNGAFNVTDICHSQLAERLNIPKRYYDRIQFEMPNLFLNTLNSHFIQKPEKRMLRTLDDRARAFLSSRYRMTDHYEVLETVLEPLLNTAGLEFKSCNITERRLYLQAVCNRMETEIKKGDIVQAGISISNSEVGHGRVRIEPLVYRLSCLNGMISQDYGLYKYHVGKDFGDLSEDEVYEIYSDETIKQSDKAFLMRIRDLVQKVFTESIFKLITDKLRETTERHIKGNPVDSVEVVTNKYNLLENEKNSIINRLISEGDLTQYGMMNAVTFTSQVIDDYDRSVKLERIGGRIIDLEPHEWQTIGEA